jgi:hypothetical protein
MDSLRTNAAALVLLPYSANKKEMHNELKMGTGSHLSIDKSIFDTATHCSREGSSQIGSEKVKEQG